MSNYGPLEILLRERIAKTGPMPVSRYMEICLTHPEYGYYTTRQPLGRDGDFTTAPEVSQMFGELLGLWAASVWSEMGSPASVQLIELGPGRGTLMADALRAIRILPAFAGAIQVHLVEISPTLRQLQREALRDIEGVQWHDTLDDIPPGPAIVIANEFFDALPVHQMVKRATGWHERMIEVDDDQFGYTLSPAPTPRFDALVPPVVRAAPNNAIFEWRSDHDIMRLARRVRDHGGAALIVDYGHLRSEAGDTFQAVAKQQYANPLQKPGLADITAHVDFQALCQAAESAGARVHGPIEQGVFLNRLGIATRAQTLIQHATKEAGLTISIALRRLTGSGKNGMGALFKVVAISNPAIERITALTDQDSVPAATGEAPSPPAVT